VARGRRRHHRTRRGAPRLAHHAGCPRGRFRGPDPRDR
jgi:hypothetical protein